MRNKEKFLRYLLLAFLSVFCMGFQKKEEMTMVSSIHLREVGKGIGEGKITPFTFLQHGNTKPLVGVAAGEKIDYDIFRFDYYGNSYQRKQPMNPDLHYYFEGEGGGFSGLCMSWEGDFWGIQVGSDYMGKVMQILGEPDEYKTDLRDSGVMWMHYIYEQAALSIKIQEGKAVSVDYQINEELTQISNWQEEMDFLRDYNQDGGQAEIIYNWPSGGSEAKNGFFSLHPHDDEYDVEKKEEALQDYLKVQGIDRTELEISYNQQGEPLIEYYVDDSIKQYCFILHLWGDYWEDYEKGISKYQDAILCTAYNLKEEEKLGYLLTNEVQGGKGRRQRLYDQWGNFMAEISYEQHENVPFPFITDFRNLDIQFRSMEEVMARESKLWLYAEESCFDEKGRLLSYNDPDMREDLKEYFADFYRCIYDEMGRLETFQLESENESEDYYGHMDFIYDEGGGLLRIEYIQSPEGYGTWDSSGSIWFDDRGRMIGNKYYVTHGSHWNMYLYDKEVMSPIAGFYFCPSIPGFEDVYLFRPYSAAE